MPLPGINPAQAVGSVTWKSGAWGGGSPSVPGSFKVWPFPSHGPLLRGQHMIPYLVGIQEEGAFFWAYPAIGSRFYVMRIRFRPLPPYGTDPARPEPLLLNLCWMKDHCCRKGLQFSPGLLGDGVKKRWCLGGGLGVG